jgi:hypothetical protein
MTPDECHARITEKLEHLALTMGQGEMVLKATLAQMREDVFLDLQAIRHLLNIAPRPEPEMDIVRGSGPEEA